MITVTLTEEQVLEANEAGEKRHASHEDAGRLDWKARKEADGVELHRAGARAEKAVAIAFGLPWTGKFKPLSEWHTWKLTNCDIGDLEVRSTTYPRGCLIIKKDKDKDKDDCPFVLVTTDNHPTYKIIGWCWGRDGKKDRYWKHHWPRPNWGVPQDELRSMSELFEVP